MPVDSGTIGGILKRVYSPEKIEDQQNRMYLTWSQFEKAPSKPTGLGFFGSVLLAGNQEGLGSQNELEGLRQSGQQRPEQFVIRPKILTDTIQFSGLSLEIAKGNEEAFANNLTFQTDEALKDAFKELNVQIFRDGTGTLSLVNGAVVASTTVVLQNVQYIKQFMKLDFFDAATNLIKQASGVQVLDINLNTNTITLDQPVTVDNLGFIYREKIHDGAPVDGKELAGLKLAVDDGTIAASYQGIPRTGAGSYFTWRGILINAGGVNLTNDLLQRTIMRMKVAGAPDPDFLVTHPQQTRKYLDIVTPLKRFDKTQTLDSGYTSLEWNGKAWKEDTDAPLNAVYLLNKSYFRKYEVHGLKMDDQSGSTLKWNPGFDSFIAYLKYYGNLGSHRPNALARLDNLTVPTF